MQVAAPAPESAPAHIQSRYGLFIGGQWRPAQDGGVREVIDPASEEVVGWIPAATQDDLDAALARIQSSLFDLGADPQESKDESAQQPERVKSMRADLERWLASVVNSLNGRDY